MRKFIAFLIFVAILLSFGYAISFPPIAPYTLPDQTSNSGKVLGTDGTNESWVTGGSITAPGSDTQVIYNDSGVFGGDAGLTYNETTNTLDVGTTTSGGNANVKATLGTELVTWTDAGWNEDGVTWTFAASTLTHVTGNTTAVTATLTAAVVAGTTYKVTITGTGGGGTATYTLGGVTGTTIAASGAIAIEDYITASTTGSLIITPASACTVAITAISVKALIDGTGDLTPQGNIKIVSPLIDPFGRVMSFMGYNELGLGYRALYSNTGASSNAFGHFALQSNTGANSNAFGYAALYNNTGASSNAFGYQALYSNTGAYSNAFGYFALSNNTVASSNAFGYYALSSNTGANSNAFGFNALYNNTGANSSAFGHHALSSNTGTTSNAFGYYALYSNTGAYSNAFGNSALYSNTGANSSAFGYYAGRYNQKDNNTVIGYNAWGNFLTNTSGNKTFDFGAINIATDRITVTTHGFGATNAYVNLLYTQGTEAIGGLTTATIYQVKIIDANTLEFRTSGRGTDITSTGAGTGHTLTPQYAYTNTTVIGANAVPTADNQVVLGTSSTTETYLFGKTRAARYTKTISSTPVTLTATEVCNADIYINTGASIVNLPINATALDGCQSTFYTIAAVAVTINPDNADIIDLIGTDAGAAGVSIVSDGNKGATIDIKYDYTNSRVRAIRPSLVWAAGS